ncbi:type I glutamate--ammonia ligase [Candidatus Endolissoclinum faulkneri]|uniref:type I glutamate--ammonia ligase n=1 Tax=Candidatus Endolissoclinum faulkneri TaxID=1263979 RepID=UPI00046D77F0|nr:type I glutamate--ammonia ligase [Candidatus Endolissoclinum faulkneri]
MCNDVKRVMKLIQERNVKYVDLRFTDPRGALQHLTQHVRTIDEESIIEGFMFDGSSIAGWKTVDESDMGLNLDLSTAVMDPFFAQPTLAITCDTFEPSTGEAYERDPRSTAKAAISYMANLGIGDTAFFGPEAEFFLFDNVKIAISMNKGYYEVDNEEGSYNSGREYDEGNLAHRPGVKGGHFPVPPVDSSQDIRSEMLSVMREMNIKVEKHHHEVAPSQHELGIEFGAMIQIADHLQLYKYVVKQVAASYGKTATFMPKPISGDNGSGMHVHQSIWKDGKPMFAGSEYANLSDTALYYIGGILKHAPAINAFTNSTTNSYKRLIPGFEAPVLLAYSARNRSASCRIPHSNSPKGKRVEVRFPDPAGNPYLSFAAMLMAGLHGIRNKIHPGNPIDKNLYDLPPKEISAIPKVCGSLREALNNLDKDRNFLTQGGVFTDDQIDGYIELKMQEVYAFEHTPHPIEFDMYYSN